MGNCCPGAEAEPNDSQRGYVVRYREIAECLVPRRKACTPSKSSIWKSGVRHHRRYRSNADEGVCLTAHQGCHEPDGPCQDQSKFPHFIPPWDLHQPWSPRSSPGDCRLPLPWSTGLPVVFGMLVTLK